MSSYFANDLRGGVDMGKNLKGQEIGKGIRQRENGLYDARANINGVDIHLSNKNLATLKKEFNERKQEIKRGNIFINNKYTLNQWFETWFKVYKIVQIKSTSIFTVKSKYNRIFGKYIGDKDIKALTNIEIQNCITQYINAGLNINELRSGFNNLEECLDSAVYNKLIKSNPCNALIIPKNNQHEQESEAFEFDDDYKYLTSKEEKLFLNTAINNWYYELFYTLLNTGMRVSEVCGLKWEDINFTNKYIKVQRQLITQYYSGKHICFTVPKTKAGFRKIPFIGNMEQILKNQKIKISERKLYLGEKWRSKDECYNGLVFYSTMGSPVQKETIQQAIIAITKLINKNDSLSEPFKKIHPHTFRHTFAVKCYENNIDAKITQVLLGHSSITVTMNIYTHLSKMRLNNEIKKLNNTSFTL